MNKFKDIKCAVTGSSIPTERIVVLESLGVPPEEMTIVSESPIKRVKLHSERCTFGKDELINAGDALDTLLRE